MEVPLALSVFADLIAFLFSRQVILYLIFAC